jgi:hypothetical protein
LSPNSFACKYCNKEYSSKQSRSNHYYLYHNKNDNHKDNHINHPDNHKYNHNNHLVTQEKEKDIRCRKCNKIFTFVQNRWRHEKTCDNNKIGKLEEQNKELVNKLNKLESKVKELSKKPSAININNTMNNIGTVGTVNNINSLGYENIRNNISEKDKMYILTSIMHEEHPITELVRKIYTDEKLKEERNTLLTNLRSKDCLIYKSETNKFEATNKNDHIDNIIETRRNDVVKIYNEFTETSKIKLKPKERQAIEDYLEKIEGIDKKDKKLKAFYEKHKEEIIYIIYNCKEFMGTIRDHLNGLENETIEV